MKVVLEEEALDRTIQTLVGKIEGVPALTVQEYAELMDPLESLVPHFEAGEIDEYEHQIIGGRLLDIHLESNTAE